MSGAPPEIGAVGTWTPVLAGALAALGDPTLRPARVFDERRGTYTISDGAGDRLAVVAGRLRHRLAAPGALPVVGDWIAARPPEDRGEDGVADASTAIIQAVLPRRTTIARRSAGQRSDDQVLAANVDTALLVMGLDGDFNLRRLERYLAVVHAGGVEPLVLLSKADLEADPAARVREVEAMAPGTAVAAVAPIDGDRALPAALTDRLRAGLTFVLLGSSGVGKSTLLNRLAGRALQLTGSVRASDSRGRHTTSYRQMFRVQGGALVIDTPGLREIQLGGDAEAAAIAGGANVDAAFPEIAALAAGCRFRDCRHAGEPGCAVAAAVAAGTLPGERLTSYERLRAEQSHHRQRSGQRRNRRR